MADRSTHKTIQVADTVFCLPAFSSKRWPTDCYIRSFSAQIFFSSTGIDILFSADCLELDDIRIPMLRSQPAAKAVAEEPDIDSMVEIAVSELVEALDPLSMIDGEMLSASERVEVEHLVEAFLHVCSEGLGKIKATPYVIPLKPGAKSFACRPYPIPQVHLEATKRDIYRLVKLGILFSDNTSKLASPTFVIPKKDGSVRLLLPTARDWKLAASAPQVELRVIARHFYELLRAYSREISRRVTTIVFPWGKFVFSCLSMGVRTAPDEFQSTMNMMLGDLDGHLSLLRRVFERFEEFGLTIHPRKSKLCTPWTDYLGYRISTTGIQPLHSKVEAIAKMASPTTHR
ncbi:Pol Polyprotein [Phytophthora megakarya]|uniref:Pol Polyprotein n=1 Tax=Phytophthora megakarya TaxID=4795 RepID=A0A225W7R9_9STRA|nr:Pol Polyprotein [Phytophthora megakarya]